MARKGRTEPPAGLVRRLDAGARAAFPVALAVLLLILAAVPVGVPGLIAAVALPCVFFWTVFRPGAMPPLAVFLLGLLHDLLAFAPVGIGPLVLLTVHGLALRGRGWLAKRGFLVVWLVFAALAAGATLAGFLLHAVLQWQMPPRPPAAMQALLAAGLYPALTWTLTRFHMAMTRAEEGA